MPTKNTSVGEAILIDDIIVVQQSSARIAEINHICRHEKDNRVPDGLNGFRGCFSRREGIKGTEQLWNPYSPRGCVYM